MSLISRNIGKMVDDLDMTCHASMDPPTTRSPVVAHKTHTGRPGRPRVEVDEQFLAAALDHRGPHSLQLQHIFGCSARTIRRRALELGLVDLGLPVISNIVGVDGAVTRVHTSGTAPSADITDEELDTLLASKLEVFPQFGRSKTTL